LYGPHGIGALYLNNRAALTGHMLGGRQERGLRAGTESVALAAGFAAAYQAVALERESEGTRLQGLRDSLARELLSTIPGLVVNGSAKHALPHMLNVSIPGIQSEYVALALDARGIAVSTKSACREGEEPESHVVAALIPDGRAHEEGWRAANSLRFSLGKGTKTGDIDRLVGTLAAVVAPSR
jgi:cysteine desulfurase